MSREELEFQRGIVARMRAWLESMKTFVGDWKKDIEETEANLEREIIILKRMEGD